MEKMQQDHLSQMDVQLDTESREHLYYSARWTSFISWVVFIGSLLLLVFLVVAFDSLMITLSRLDPTGSLFADAGTTVFIILILAILFIAFLYFFLWRFSSRTRQSLVTEQAETLLAGIQSLKVYFSISVVVSILVLIYNIYRFIDKLINH